MFVPVLPVDWNEETWWPETFSYLGMCTLNLNWVVSFPLTTDCWRATSDFQGSPSRYYLLQKCNSIFSEVLKLRHPQLQETVFLKICFIVNMEFWKYRFPNLWISWFWDFSEPGFSKMWISEFLIVGISEHLDFSKYGFLKIWIYRILDIWKSGFPNVWISWFCCFSKDGFLKI